MLSKAELRKLIRAHNVLSKITIPKGASLEDMEKLVQKAGYKVNHEKKRLDAQVKRGKQITLKQAEEITKPKPKTALQKQKAQEKKEEKEMERKKKEREIRKKAVAEEKKRQEKKMPPKKATIGTQTETPKKPKKKIKLTEKGEKIREEILERKKKKKIIKKPKAGSKTEEQIVKEISDDNIKNAKQDFQNFFVGKLEFFDDKVKDKAIKDGVIKSNGDLNTDYFALDSRPNYMATLNITTQERGRGYRVEGTEGVQGRGIPYLQIISEYQAKTSKERAEKKNLRTNYRLKKIK